MKMQFAGAVAVIALGAFVRAVSAAPADRQDLCLWYTHPAREWTEALPIGNGRLGAMVLGNVADDRIILRGRIKREHDQTHQNVGMKFEAHVLAQAKGGAVASQDGKLSVDKADELLLLIAGATDYRGSEPAGLCRTHLAAAADSYERLRDRHVADHRRLFRRVRLDLGRTENTSKPTDQRLAGIAKGVIRPKAGGICRVRTVSPIRVSPAGAPVSATKPHKGVVEFETQAGRNHILDAENR